MSERLEFKGDFMGFTYNGKHSSELGIVRVSDGSRFNENLLPTIQDKTVQVPGGDGTYYFGSYYTQRQFNVSFAFDSLTEEQIAMLRTHFGDKQIHYLIFDETPYKVYSAKVTGIATIKYIPFDEGTTHRLYKGEGNIQFTCYYPFARCVVDNKTIIEHYNNSNNIGTSFKDYLRDMFPNIDEWWNSVGFGPRHNFGDTAVPFQLTMTQGMAETSFEIEDTTIDWSQLPSGVQEAVLDTGTGLVKVVEVAEPSQFKKGEVLNKYVKGNLTAKIPKDWTETVPDYINFTCLFF